MCRWSGGTVVWQRSQRSAPSATGAGEGGAGLARPRSPEIIDARVFTGRP